MQYMVKWTQYGKNNRYCTILILYSQLFALLYRLMPIPYIDIKYHRKSGARWRLSSLQEGKSKKVVYFLIYVPQANQEKKLLSLTSLLKGSTAILAKALITLYKLSLLSQ